MAERGKTLVQKKPTMYPEWKSTFDAHIYEGRVIQIVLMRAAEEPMSEVTVGVSVLAERCKKNNGKAEFWVRARGLQRAHARVRGGVRVRGLQWRTHVCGVGVRTRGLQRAHACVCSIWPPERLCG